MTFQDAQKALCRKLDIDYSDITNNGLFTLDDIKGYLNDAGREVWDYRFWDFAEDAKTATLDSSDITNGWIPYPQSFVSGSLFYFRIAGKEQAKKRFQDFLKLLQDYPNTTDKVWAEHKRKIFINTNVAAAADSVDLYGKATYADLSADSDLMPFGDTTVSGDSQSLNQAVVTLAYSFALGSEKKKNESAANVERQKAYIVIDANWSQLVAGQAAEQPKNRPMFDAPDFYSGGSNGRSYNIGKFGND